MAPSANKDDQKKSKTGRRKLVQPVLPILPRKPKSASQAAASGEENESAPTGSIAALSQPESRRGSIPTTLLQEAGKEVVEATPRPLEPAPLVNGAKYEDTESSISGSSSNTQKALSVPEPASTPASEVTNPPTDRLNHTEDQIPRVDLGGSVGDEVQDDEQTLSGDSTSSVQNGFTPAEHLLDVLPTLRSSGGQQTSDVSSSEWPTQNEGFGTSHIQDRGLELDSNPLLEADTALGGTPNINDNNQELGPEHLTYGLNGGALFNPSSSSSKLQAMQANAHVNPPESTMEILNKIPLTGAEGLSTSFLGDGPTLHDKHISRADIQSDPLPEIDGIALDPNSQQNMSSLEVLNENHPRPLEEEITSVLPVDTSDVRPTAQFFHPKPFQEQDLAYGMHQTHVLPSLHHYLQQLFLYRQDFDCVVSCQLPSAPHAQNIYSTHGIIVSRSRVMRDLLLQAKVHQQGRTVTSIHWTPPVDIQGAAFEAVLKFLYTDVPLKRHEIGTVFHSAAVIDPMLERSPENNNLDMVASYCLAGLLLELPPVHTQGQQLLSEMMSWDVAEFAVKRALEFRQLGEYLMAANAFNDDLSHNPQNGTTATDADVLNSKTRGNSVEWFGRELLKLVFAFMCRRWDTDLHHFNLDISQQQIVPTYLPLTPELASSLRKSNVALQRLQFGAMPISDNDPSDSTAVSSQQSSLQSRAVSVILVNLPFADLAQFYSQLKSDLIGNTGIHGNVDEVFEAVIQERERRRRIVLQSTQVSFERKYGHPGMWDVVGYRESLQSIGGESFLKSERTAFFDATRYDA